MLPSLLCACCHALGWTEQGILTNIQQRCCELHRVPRQGELWHKKPLTPWSRAEHPSPALGQGAGELVCTRVETDRGRQKRSQALASIPGLTSSHTPSQPQLRVGRAKAAPQPWDERCCRKQFPSFPPLWRELWNRFFSNALAEQQDGERLGKVPAETWHCWPELPCVLPGEGPLDHGHAAGSRAGWVQKGALRPLTWANPPL